MRAAIYARFSSDNQREQSIDDQIRVCKDYAARSDIFVLDKHIYFDEAKSGSLRNRPGLESMKKAAEDKLFDAILVDDSSRLSRDNQYFNTMLCLFQFWGVNLISVSDGLDMREEHAKVAYQFRGIINELYLSDLKKKTHRGQMGQVLRGYSMGGSTYGYKSVPDGETKYDKKGRLRANGFKRVIVAEEALMILRIYKDFCIGKAITKIAQELNQNETPTKNRLKGGWNVSTIARILKDEKYLGRYTWNKTQAKKDPMTGRTKQVPRPKEEWVIQVREEMRIISDDMWKLAQKRWSEIEHTYPTMKGKKGFEGRQKSYVLTHPPHILSGGLRCGVCDGSISLVSGKNGGYYGCLNSVKKTCDNKMMISRKRLEDHFIKILYDKVFKADALDFIFQKTAEKIKDHFSYIPEELRLKKIELNRAETRLKNFIEFIAEGRATTSITDAVEIEEKKANYLKKDVESLESAKEQSFQPPPREWIEHCIGNLKHLLEERTEKSAITLRRLTGPITLTPKYYHASCKFKSFALLEEGIALKKSEGSAPKMKEPLALWDNGSNSLLWWA
ncbi:MAG: recombinase family protein [Proteobacteria bacterium]|nr:recombinase family protein [Pseudomonadota bacterium]